MSITWVVVTYAWLRRRRCAAASTDFPSAGTLHLFAISLSFSAAQHVILVSEWWRDSVAWFDAVTILGALAVGPLAAVILAMAVSVIRHE